MKKLVSLILALAMLLTMVSALADGKHYDYTISYIGASGAEEDEMYNYFCDMFNLDIEMVGYSWADYASAASTMINGGTMFDMMTVDTGFGAIEEYADQGLIRALPDDWQTKYPNIYAYMNNAGLVDVLTLDDGRVYCVPKAIYSHFTGGDLYLWHYTVYYRQDWAEKLGYNFGDTVTISELNAFNKACIEQNLSGSGKTIGLTLRPALISELMRLEEPNYSGFTREGDKYVWNPTRASVVDAICNIKTMYNEGLLDSDFYLYSTGGEQNAFCSGQAASMIFDGLIGSYGSTVSNLVSSGAAANDDDGYAKVGVTVLVNDKGVWYGSETSNYCWANVFSPDMSDEKFDRLLQLLDYLYTKEGELVYNLGIKDVAWYEDAEGYKWIYYNEAGDKATLDVTTMDLYALTLNEDGTYTVGEQVGNARDENNTYQAISYPSKAFWFRQAILGDDFMLVDPGAHPIAKERISKCYAARSANAQANGFTRIDWALNFYNSTALDEYSVDISGEILRLIADRNIAVEDVKASWETFIENNRVMWEPALNDINANLCK